jgi:hypothetical protein
VEPCTDNVTSAMSVTPLKPGGNNTWSDTILTVPTVSRVTNLGWTSRPPERLTYAPAVDLRYLGEMVERDHVELAAMYLSLRCMELVLVGPV